MLFQYCDPVSTMFVPLPIICMYNVAPLPRLKENTLFLMRTFIRIVCSITCVERPG